MIKKYIQHLKDRGHKPTSICMLYISYPLIGFKNRKDAKKAYQSFFGQNHLPLPICVNEKRFNEVVNDLLPLITPPPEVYRFIDGEIPENMRK